jgi:hypothetical protein
MALEKNLPLGARCDVTVAASGPAAEVIYLFSYRPSDIIIKSPEGR